MANSQTRRGRNQDRARVAGGQDHEVRYEAAKNSSGKAEVKSPVKSVGNSRKKVENKLDKGIRPASGFGSSAISLHGGGSPEAMKREIWRNYPVMEKVELVESLLDRGILDDGRRVSKQPGRCCATGCQVPEPPKQVETAATEQAAE